MTVIGVVGSAGHGKSSVSGFIVDHFDFIEMSFAEPIKIACMHIFDLRVDQLHDRVLKEQKDNRWDLSPREMFQKLGTDFGRDMISEDIWIQNLESRIINAIKDKKNVVVSDVRFHNEADFLRQRFNAQIIRVHRPTFDCLNINQAKHISEIAGVSIHADYNIYNTASLEDLEKSVIQYMNDNIKTTI